MITVLAGGTGSIKIIRGISASQLGGHISIISNVGDNFWFHGLYICPDIDTTIYGLAGILDKKRGWGIKNDTFCFLKHLKRLKEEHWFKIGDRDLSTHIIRTKMLHAGHSLSDVTNWMATKKYKLESSILPVTDTHMETRIVTNYGDVHIQDFWVQHKGKLDIYDIYYKNNKKAKIDSKVLDALKYSKLIIIAPANPISSIGPMLSIPAFREAIISQREKVVALSPLIGNKAISGPAKRYLAAKKIYPSPAGIAKFYSTFISKFVLSNSDSSFSKTINEMGIDTYETNIIMNNIKDESRLANFILKNIE